ncbi:unnamed protein product [Effrenium voratum]|uniref:Uncharacterized protein n=1 Tax=Effrenium voratum TaxID=2562239 RepID=A0AA36HKV3_9DINO|nr:unnamed protein product [Effrenium voratum]
MYCTGGAMAAESCISVTCRRRKLLGVLAIILAALVALPGIRPWHASRSFTLPYDPCTLTACKRFFAAMLAGGAVPFLGELSRSKNFLPIMLLVALVLQKCGADALTWFTKAHLQLPYSGSNVSLISEVLKPPLILLALASFQSAHSLGPTMAAAVSQSPLAMWWMGLLYAAQNLLYFVCLQFSSAAAYQVLSQCKMIFTAVLMWQMLDKRFSRLQLISLTLLVIGAVCTQLAEVQGPVERGARPWLGAALTVLSALLSALPNVFYERCLKEEQKDQWVANLQLTAWITIWTCIIKGWAAVCSGTVGVPHLADMFAGFSPLVWVIVLLKTLNCIIVPACLKYGDNILYAYAKPLSIVLTCAAISLSTSTLPSPAMLAGIAMVVVSIIAYSRG